MSCQSLFSGKNKKNIINLSSAESAQRMVKVKSLTVSQGHSSSDIWTHQQAMKKTCLNIKTSMS